MEPTSRSGRDPRALAPDRVFRLQAVARRVKRAVEQLGRPDHEHYVNFLGFVLGPRDIPLTGGVSPDAHVTVAFLGMVFPPEIDSIRVVTPTIVAVWDPADRRLDQLPDIVTRIRYWSYFSRTD